MNESQEQTAAEIDQLTCSVALITGLHRAPADDPSFYELKDQVRSHLRASIDEPLSWALAKTFGASQSEA